MYYLFLLNQILFYVSYGIEIGILPFKTSLTFWKLTLWIPWLVCIEVAPYRNRTSGTQQWKISLQQFTWTPKVGRHSSTEPVYWESETPFPCNKVTRNGAMPYVLRKDTLHVVLLFLFSVPFLNSVSVSHWQCKSYLCWNSNEIVQWFYKCMERWVV